MKKYSEFVEIQEHNPMTVRNIVKKVNPLDNLQTRLKMKQSHSVWRKFQVYTFLYYQIQ